MSVLRLKRVFPHALPVMLGYLAIGIACGVLENKVGFHPFVAFIFSMAYFTGSGQFMIPSLWLAGTAMPTIIISTALVSSRQVLYAAAFSPFFTATSRMESLIFGATVTDESFGVNLDRFQKDESWSTKDALVLNILCQLSWATANMLGCALGEVLAIPLGVLSFAMTSIFICLLMGQQLNGIYMLSALAAFVGVFVCKLFGLQSLAILVGALTGLAVGVIAMQVEDKA